MKPRSVPEIMRGWKELDLHLGSLLPRKSLIALCLCIGLTPAAAWMLTCLLNAGLRLPVPVGAAADKLWHSHLS